MKPLPRPPLPCRLAGLSLALRLALGLVPLLALEPARAAAPLTLAEAERAALSRQPQLRQARAASEAASARAGQALAPLLPQVTASAGYDLDTANFHRAPPSPAHPDPWAVADSRAASLRLSQTLFDATLWKRRSAALSSAEAQRESERSTGSQVLLAARTAFFTARAAKDLVTVARETLANQEAHLRQIEGFVEVGTRPAIDVAQARTDRANARVQLVNAENGYETAKAQLNLAMGIDGPTGYDVADEALPAVEGEGRGTEELLAEALRQRADLAALGRQIEAQRATLGAAQAGYLPALQLSTSIDDQAAAIPGASYWNWNAGASLTWNLFQGGLTRAQASEAQANLEGLGAQMDGLRQQVWLDVEQARLAVRAAQGALEAAGEALANARERLRLAEGRYQTGVGSVIEQGDAQLALTAAAAQRVQAEYALASARAQLLRALGRTPAAS